jgi:putative heme transporter
VARHWRSVAHWLVVGAAVGYLAWTVPGLADEAAEAIGQLDSLHWGWLVVAVLFAVAALVLYGELHRQLLRAGGARLSAATVQGINFVENAVATTVPVVGGAGAVVYGIDQLRRRCVDSALASFSVLAAGVVATLSLLVLGALGLGVAGRIPLVLGVSLAVVIVAGSVGAWKALTHPAVLHRGLRLLVPLARWLPRVCRSCRNTWATRADEVALRLSARITLLRPTAARWLGLITLAGLTWVLDYVSLAASVAAVGYPVPWGVLLVGFLLVQLSIALQIFPGGAGLAETSLLGALLGAGVAAAPAASTVLIYRLITWAGLSLLGWAVYAFWIHTAPLHFHRHAPEVSRAKCPQATPEM